MWCEAEGRSLAPISTGGICGAKPRAGALLQFSLVECVVRSKLQAFFRKKNKENTSRGLYFFLFLVLGTNVKNKKKDKPLRHCGKAIKSIACPESYGNGKRSFFLM